MNHNNKSSDALLSHGGETHLRVSQNQVVENCDLTACSQLPTLKRGRGSSWEPRD